MFDTYGTESLELVLLYTDSYKVRGTLRTRARRLTDVLNSDDSQFLVLEDVTFEELGSGTTVHRAPYAQINLSTVLFGVATEAAEPRPEMRTLKVEQEALISLPPFTIRGHIHLVPELDLRGALALLQARFIPVTSAVYWSDYLDEARTEVAMVAFNHAHAQILAPYEGDADVWQGLEGAPASAPVSPTPAAGVWDGLDTAPAATPNTLSDRPAPDLGER